MANYSNNLGQIRLGWRTAVSTTPVNTNDVDATAFITAAGITDSTQISALNTLVNDLKTYGLWTKMKALYPFVGGSAASHKFNLKDPRDLNAAYRLVFNGGWIHSSNGAKPNGTTGYADTFFIPSASLTNNSSHLSYYSRTNRGLRNSYAIGSFQGSPTYNNMDLRFYGYGYNNGVNKTSSAQYDGWTGQDYADYTPTTTTCFVIASKTAVNLNKIYENGILKGSNTNTSLKSLPNVRTLIGAESNGPSGVIGYDNLESAFATIGDGLSDTEASNFYISVQKFQTTLGRHVGTPYVSDPDAIAFLMAAGITDGTQATAINTLVIRMKADGVWTKMKAIYPFVGGNATSHKFNLKDPRDLDAAYRLVFNGGWTHTSTGAQPNGTNGYAETYLNPAVVFTDFKNNGHLSLYSRTENPIGPGWNIGVGNAEQTGDPLYGLSIKRPSWNGYTNPIMYDFGNYTGNGRMLLVGSDARGFWIGSTTASNSHRFYKDGSIFTSNTNVASGNISNASFHIGKINNTSGSTFYGLNNELSIVSIGDGLTDTEATALYSAVQSYQTTLGRQVNIPLVSDTDAQAFLNAANITSFQQASAVNKLVVDLKAAGVWSKMKAIYPFVGGSSTSHKFNLKDPRDLDAAFRLQFNGGWTHNSNGVTPNGTNGYADTYLTPNTSLSLLNQHISFYSRTNSASGVDIAAGESATTIQIWGSTLYYDVSSGGYKTISVSNSTGLIMAQRLNYVNNVFKNNSKIKTDNLGSYEGFLSSTTIELSRVRTGGYYSNKNLAFATIGNAMSDTEASAFYTAVETYQTSLGRGVNTPIYNNGLVLNLDAGNANSYPGTGTTWFDLASGNNGTLFSGITYDVNNGGGLIFNGSNQYISSFNNTNLNFTSSDKFTISCFFKATSTSSFLGLVVSGNTSGEWNYGIWVTDGKIQVGTHNNNRVGNSTIVIGQIYQATLTYSNNTMKVYLNGINDGTFTSFSLFNGLNQQLVIGRKGANAANYFPGTVYNVQIYNRELSATEILNNFNSSRGRFGL